YLRIMQWTPTGIVPTDLDDDDDDLKVCDSKLSKNSNIINYTYLHETLRHSSYIDYFMISNKLIVKVNDFDIIDCAVNLSDHCPIVLKISLAIIAQQTMRDRLKPETSNKKNHISHQTLRWDHGDTGSYYMLTQSLAQPVY